MSWSKHMLSNCFNYVFTLLRANQTRPRLPSYANSSRLSPYKDLTFYPPFRTEIINACKLTDALNDVTMQLKGTVGVKLKLLMMRISLSERIVPPLFEGTDDRFKRGSRRDYLVKAFSKPRNIHSWGNDYSYIGFGEEDGFYAGAIGRRREEEHYDGPENDFNVSKINFWERSNVYLNLAKDQQVLAIEENNSVGSAWTLARALVSHINQTSQDAGWKADLFKITKEGDFWRTINDFDGPITEVQFKYVVPNVIFSGGDDTRKALRGVKNRLNGRELELTVKNPDGLNLDDEQLRDSVEYTSKGGGEAKAKSGKKIVYQEGEHPVIEELDDSVKDVSVGEGKLKNFLSKIVRR